MRKTAELLAAVALLSTGFCMIVFGDSCGPKIFELLPDTEFGFWLELLVPFLFLSSIGTGALLYVSWRRRE